MTIEITTIQGLKISLIRCFLISDILIIVSLISCKSYVSWGSQKSHILYGFYWIYFRNTSCFVRCKKRSRMPIRLIRKSEIKIAPDQAKYHGQIVDVVLPKFALQSHNLELVECIYYYQRCGFSQKWSNINNSLFYWLFGIFRPIFDSSNKMTLLILLRINALKVKKSKSLRESLSKSLKIDWKVIFLAQFRLAQDSAWLSSTQLDSARLSWTQLDSAQLSSTQLNSARLSST